MCLLSADGIAKLQKMWLKHQSDVRTLHATTTEDVIHLDRPYKTRGTLREFISKMKHTKNKTRLFHSVDKSQSWMDETGMTTIMTAFPENRDEAESMAQLLPALVEHDINTECAQEWFTPDAYDRSRDIQYDKENNTFVSADEKMMDYLLADELQQVEIEGIPKEDDPATPEKPRGSDQSFVSFGYALDKTSKSKTPGTDLLSTPTATSEMTEITKLNKEQKTIIDKLRAEVDNLKLLHNPPGETGTTKTMPKDSESIGKLSDDGAADSDAASGTTA
jgi:hypothetical protein